MKHTKNHVVELSVEARELALFADNEREVYPRIIAAVNCCHKHFKRGKYDEKKAIDAFYYVADFAARLYNRNFGYMFTVTERYTAAAILLDCHYENIENGDL